MKKKILIVEDDNLISTIFKMFLKELGYDLLGIVEDGKEAIRQCSDLKPDIVLMDVHLGGDLDGIQATEIIKQKFDIPVIFLSSDTEEATIQRVIQTHSYGYLVKPIDKRALGITIELAFYKHEFDMEQQLREKRYRNFITDSPEAILVVNEQGGIDYMNCLGLKLFRTAYIEDLMGLPLLSFVDDAFNVDFKESLDMAFEMNRGIEYTHLRMKTIHGDYFDVGLTGAQIEFGGKKTLQLILRDITQDYAYRHMLAEKANIINNMYDGVVTTDLQGAIKSWNKGCERIFGLREDEVLNHYVEDLNILSQKVTFKEFLINATIENEKIERELIYQRKEGDVFLSFSSSILLNGAGEKQGVVCYVKDISEKKKNEALIKKSEQRNRNLINAIPDLLFVINSEGIFVDYKVDDDSLLSVREDTIIGTTVQEVFESPFREEVEQILKRVLSSKKMEKTKFQMDTAKGLRWFEARLTYLDEEKSLVLVRPLD